MVLPRELVQILVCPKSKQSLIYFPHGEADTEGAPGFLLCPASRLRYRIEDDVPVMLVDEAEELPADAVDRLVRRAGELGLVSA